MEIKVLKFNLDKIAEEKGLTAGMIVKACGLNRQTVWGLLSGQSPSIKTLNKIMNGLGVDIASLWRLE